MIYSDSEGPKARLSWSMALISRKYALGDVRYRVKSTDWGGGMREKAEVEASKGRYYKYERESQNLACILANG